MPKRNKTFTSIRVACNRKEIADEGRYGSGPKPIVFYMPLNDILPLMEADVACVIGKRSIISSTSA